MKALYGLISVATLVGVGLIFYKVRLIMATQAELAQALTATSDQLDKAKTEINTRIQELTDAISNSGQTSPEVDAALARLQQSTQGLDDIVPDPQNV